jgi:hypothetical protein
MKQTAVEQFIEQLEKQGDSWENVSMGTINISIKVEDYLQLKKQAKEMEKERMIDLVQQLKDYTKESRNVLGFDEREACEFVEIFTNQTFKSK